jgi:hypothetical protein
MRQIAIVGAGQSGLQLAIGLQRAGYRTTVISAQTPQQIAGGRVTSSQCMFASSLAHERDVQANFWDDSCPPVSGIQITVATGERQKAFEWAARLDAPARSVDQRVKMPRWIEEYTRSGGDFRVQQAGVPELERLAQEHELVIVAAGKGEVAALFTRDEANSPFAKPMRALALTYVQGLRPREGYSGVCFNLIPGVGEYFVFPALTTSGPCEIMVFEGVPGGSMDCWADATSPQKHLEISLAILKRFLPWEYDRATRVSLTDANGILAGRFAPTVRKPVASLPSGRPILGMGDVVCLNDPITGQGSNNASKCAASYLESILSHDRGSFDPAWMNKTFAAFWEYARLVTAWTNGMLEPPPPHVLQLLAAAASKPSLASWFANGFDDPTRFTPVLADPVATERFIKAAA